MSSEAYYTVEELRSLTVALENAGDLQVIRVGENGNRVMAQFSPNQSVAARTAALAFTKLDAAQTELRKLGVVTREDKLVGALRGVMPLITRKNEEVFEAQVLLADIEEEEGK